MRHTLLIFQFIIIGFSFGQIENGAAKPFCKEVVSALNILDEMPLDEYKKLFISYDELMEYKEDSTVSEQVRRELSMFTVDIYHEQIQNSHLSLRNNNFRNFEWSKVKFKGITMERDDDDGVRVLEGMIKLKLEKSEYSVHCIAVRLGGVYKLMILDQPKAIKEVDPK